MLLTTKGFTSHVCVADVEGCRYEEFVRAGLRATTAEAAALAWAGVFHKASGKKKPAWVDGYTTNAKGENEVAEAPIASAGKAKVPECITSGLAADATGSNVAKPSSPEWFDMADSDDEDEDEDSASSSRLPTSHVTPQIWGRVCLPTFCLGETFASF
jgi:hypothetical protein